MAQQPVQPGSALAGPVCCRTAPTAQGRRANLPRSSTTRFRSSGIHWRTAPITVGDSVPILAFLHDNFTPGGLQTCRIEDFRSVRLRNRVWGFSAYVDFPKPRAFERSRCRGGRFAWFDRAIAMSQNKIGVSGKISIEYPYKQLPCQTQGGFLQTALSAVTRRSRSCSSPVLLRRVTPDRVLASGRIYPVAAVPSQCQ